MISVIDGSFFESSGEFEALGESENINRKKMFKPSNKFIHTFYYVVLLLIKVYLFFSLASQLLFKIKH